MIIFILIHVQYLQHVVSSFEKSFNGRNHSLSGTHHLKKNSPKQNFPFCLLDDLPHYPFKLFRKHWKTISKTSKFHVNYNPAIQERNFKFFRTFAVTPLKHEFISSRFIFNEKVRDMVKTGNVHKLELFISYENEAFLKVLETYLLRFLLCWFPFKKKI